MKSIVRRFNKIGSGSFVLRRTVVLLTGSAASNEPRRLRRLTIDASLLVISRSTLKRTVSAVSDSPFENLTSSRSLSSTVAGSIRFHSLASRGTSCRPGSSKPMRESKIWCGTAKLALTALLCGSSPLVTDGRAMTILSAYRLAAAGLAAAAGDGAATAAGLLAAGLLPAGAGLVAPGVAGAGAGAEHAASAESPAPRLNPTAARRLIRCPEERRSTIGPAPYLSDRPTAPLLPQGEG